VPGYPGNWTTAPGQASPSAASANPAPVTAGHGSSYLTDTLSGLGEFGDATEPGAAANQVPLFTVPPQRTIASVALSGSTLGAALWVVAAGIGVIVAAISEGRGVMAALVAGIVPLWPMLAIVGKRLTSEMNFVALGTPDGVVLRHGLTQLVSQTVPRPRVQAFRLVQPLLWRRFRWWRMDANVAGYGLGEDTKALMLPVGSFAQAAQVLWYLAPRLVSPQMEDVWRTALTGSGPTPGFVVSPRSARWLDPWAWRRLAYAVTPDALIIRSGFWVRTVVIVPHARTQAVSIGQGPWQRGLGLASVNVHSTIGPVVPWVRHLNTADAVRLARDQLARVRGMSGGPPPMPVA
jgi:putative membrane protein